uniref:ARAD1D42658p n=1 Tax=Blastobotrys adeninivorans TaxID=409370 RepID=A0A060TCW1_BLAAD
MSKLEEGDTIDLEKNYAKQEAQHRGWHDGFFYYRDRSRLCTRIAMVVAALGLLRLSCWLTISACHQLQREVIHPIEAVEDSPVNIIGVQSSFPDYGEPVAEQLIMGHEFKNSYGNPYVGTFEPLQGVEFSHVKLELRASTSGTQFDRLGHVYLGGAEIWRTSTAEPGKRDIKWSYVKDVSAYTSLFRKRNDLVVQLDNIVNEQYTGVISVQLIAKYYNVPTKNEIKTIYDWYQSMPVQATKVIPIRPVNVEPNQPFLWQFPRDDIISTPLNEINENTTRVVVDVFASGNAGEEFWYTHVEKRFGDLLGLPGEDFGRFGPLRFVEVYIDDELAGNIVPFPVIYTGGISPGLWNAIVGINAYDVPSYRVDLTPFLPRLLQRRSRLRLVVSNGLGDVKTDNNWLINANVMVWEVTGVTVQGQELPGDKKEDHENIGFLSGAETLAQITSADRSLCTIARLHFRGAANGDPHGAFAENDQILEYQWTEKASVSNVQEVVKGPLGSQTVASAYTGSGIASVNDSSIDTTSFAYPLALSTKELSVPSNGFKVKIARGYEYDTLQTSLHTAQNGTALSQIIGNRYFGGPSSLRQTYDEQSVVSGSFHRLVQARNGTIIRDSDRHLQNWVFAEAVMDDHDLSESLLQSDPASQVPQVPPSVQDATSSRDGMLWQGHRELLVRGPGFLKV